MGNVESRTFVEIDWFVALGNSYIFLDRNLNETFNSWFLPIFSHSSSWPYLSELIIEFFTLFISTSARFSPYICSRSLDRPILSDDNFLLDLFQTAGTSGPQPQLLLVLSLQLFLMLFTPKLPILMFGLNELFLQLFNLMHDIEEFGLGLVRLNYRRLQARDTRRWLHKDVFVVVFSRLNHDG